MANKNSDKNNLKQKKTKNTSNTEIIESWNAPHKYPKSTSGNQEPQQKYAHARMSIVTFTHLLLTSSKNLSKLGWLPINPLALVVESVTS